MITDLDRVKGIIKLFEKKQSEFSDFGASDTEPDGVFQEILIKALAGTIDIPITIDGWQLYSTMKGSGPAARQLSKFARMAAKIVKEAIFNSDDPHEVKEYVQDYCWRC